MEGMLKKSTKRFGIVTLLDRFFEINFEWAEIYVKSDQFATFDL